MINVESQTDILILKAFVFVIKLSFVLLAVTEEKNSARFGLIRTAELVHRSPNDGIV